MQDFVTPGELGTGELRGDDRNQARFVEDIEHLHDRVLDARSCTVWGALK